MSELTEEPDYPKLLNSTALPEILESPDSPVPPDSPESPAQSVTFVKISTQMNIRIYSYIKFDTNQCLNKYL